MKVIDTVQGKHLLGDYDDKPLMKCLEQGWRIPYKPVCSALIKQRAIACEKAWLERKVGFC